MFFSFYYTEKISNYVLEKNPLYQEINNNKKNYEITSVSAIIDNEYIIPGYNGLAVNVKDSYYNMKSFNTFNSFYLIFNDITPQISLEDNKDKIIIKGNPNKNSISFIIEEVPTIKEYFASNNIPCNLLVTMDNFEPSSSFELINNDAKNYQQIETLLDKNSINKNLCVINKNIEAICRDNQKYLIEPITITNSNFLTIKSNIESGNIYLIKNGTSLDNIKQLIKTINYKDIQITTLSNLISEER